MSTLEVKTDFKEKVKQFINAANTNDPQTAKGLVHVDYIQHNPNVPTGREPFLGLFPVLQQFGTRAETIRMLADGNYVALHNIWHNATPFGADKMVAFDILRIDADGLIAEHWDAMMVDTAPNAAGRTLVDGETDITNLDETDANRDLITAFINAAIQAEPDQFANVINTYFQADFLQHNPNAGDGISGLLSAVQNGDLQFAFTQLHKVIAEGNFVLSVTEGLSFGKEAVFYDLFHIEDGKVAEHWDVIQEIPAESVHGNSMFGF